jgi:serine/threonine protein kinase
MLNPDDYRIVPSETETITGTTLLAFCESARKYVTIHLLDALEYLFWKWVGILSQISHETFLPFHGFLVSHPNIGLIGGVITSKMPTKTLLEVMTPQVGPSWGYADSLHIFHVLFGLAQGIAYLHRKTIWHLNLSPSVIFVDEFQPYIVGFEQATMESCIDDCDHISTNLYSAPELMNGGAVSAACDVFSFGLLAVAVIGGESFVYNRDYATWDVDNELSVAPEEWRNLIKKCCASEPRTRPTAQEVVDILSSATFTLDSERIAS